MARVPKHLNRWLVIVVIVVAVAFLPLVTVYGSLRTSHPRSALLVFVSAYSSFIACVGFLAWTSWAVVLRSYRVHYDPAARSVGARLRALLREPLPLYFAGLFTLGTIGAMIYLVREVLRRAV